MAWPRIIIKNAVPPVIATTMFKVVFSLESHAEHRTSMHTLVISLRYAKERRTFQVAQLKRLGLPFDVLDAVGWDETEQHVGELRTDAWERPLMPTELACFLSHRNAWTEVSKGKDPILILEDDVLLSERVAAFLDEISGLDGIDHLSLETRLRHKLLEKSMPLRHGFSIARMRQDRTGAAAYVLWPDGARRLLRRAELEGAALADAFIANDDGLRSFQAIPPIVIQSDIAHFYGIVNLLPTQSYIQAHGPREAHRAKGYIGLRMKFRRFLGQLQQAQRWLYALGKARRVKLQPDPIGFDFRENA